MRAKFRCRVGVGQQNIRSVQYKNHYAYESPHKYSKTNMCVCVCACVCVVFGDEFLSQGLHLQSHQRC